MGVTIMNKYGGSSFNWSIWRWLLTLACEHGWKPAGTVFAERDEDGNIVPLGAYQQWYGCDESDLKRGSYCSNDGQWVTDDDAASLSRALEHAMREIPGPEPEHRDSMGGYNEIMSFIRSCRKGGFYIL